MKYLFLLTISPVQSFIAQARTTADLYAGSTILSELCRSGIRAVQDHGGTVIYPYPENQSLPNRLVAILDITEDEAHHIGSQIEEQVRASWRDLAQHVLQLADVPEPNGFMEQIDHFFWVTWVFAPYAEGERYRDAYMELERRLGTVKNVRWFQQTKELGRKCHLCGERNVLFCPKGSLDRFLLRPAGSLTEREQASVHAYNHNLVEVDNLYEDGLCAVCFVKRFYRKIEEHAFPSTASIALMNVIHQLKNDKTGAQLLSAYKAKIKPNFDAVLLFPENVTEEYFEKYRYDITAFPDIKNAYDQLAEYIQKEKLQINPYYAILIFDGDSMGEWLSGQRLADISQLENFHRDFSRRVGRYAAEIRQLLKPPEGTIVYAGGDDFIGLINLHSLFSVMQRLREMYDAEVSRPLAKYFKDRVDRLTFSAGVAVAHYKTPLGEVLKIARKMEKVAKSKRFAYHESKDAVALAVMKRSGEVEQAVWKWKDETEWITQLLQDFILKLQTEISDTFIRKLIDEFRPLLLDDGTIPNPGKAADRMIEAEWLRLLKRTQHLERASSESDDAFRRRKQASIEEMADLLKKLFQNRDSHEDFFNTLQVLAFLNKAVNSRD